MTSKVKPSKVEGLEGCRKAAEIIMQDDEYIFTTYGKKTVEGLTELIADQTAVPETAAERDRLKEVNAVLLEALKQIEKGLEMDGQASAVAAFNHWGRQAIKAASEGRAE